MSEDSDYESSVNMDPVIEAAEDDEQALLERCLMDVLGFSEDQVMALFDDGYICAMDLAHWDYDEITAWVSHKEKLRPEQGGLSFGDMRRKGLIGLAWWITDRIRLGEAVDITLFDESAKRASIIESKVEKSSKSSDSESAKPDKFKYEDWPEWERSLHTYLLSLRNVQGIPLVYVIRKNNSMEIELDDRTRKLVSSAPLQGVVFRNDSQRVLLIIKSLTTGTDAENWIKGISCGRMAMRALQDHYDGSAEAEKRKEAARADIKSLFYKNESSFSFERYINRLKKSFDTLEKYGVPIYEEDKVKYLLDKIQSTHSEVRTQVSICRSSHAGSFIEASTYMSKEISRIFPGSNVNSANFQKGKLRGRNISRIGTNKRGGKGAKKKVNGVDITDPTRYFSPEEWKKLDRDTRKSILDNPERKKKKDERESSGNKNAKRGISEAKTTDKKDDDEVEKRNSLIASIVTGVMNAQQQVQDGEKKTPAGPKHGSRAVSSVDSSKTERRVKLKFDHHGDLVE